MRRIGPLVAGPRRNSEAVQQQVEGGKEDEQKGGGNGSGSVEG